MGWTSNIHSLNYTIHKVTILQFQNWHVLISWEFEQNCQHNNVNYNNKTSPLTISKSILWTPSNASLDYMNVSLNEEMNVSPVPKPTVK